MQLHEIKERLQEIGDSVQITTALGEALIELDRIHDGWSARQGFRNPRRGYRLWWDHSRAHEARTFESIDELMEALRWFAPPRLGVTTEEGGDHHVRHVA
ncbi:MAG: hypothetical protein HQL66_03135 [Magnetococcales bacterium]|nr:hypothetical protein [Magnetococcales bacterium]